jgi:hypothetical protein
MNASEHAFRPVMVRRRAEDKACLYRYTVVASNRVESAADTMDWYCQRGETGENRIKELKIGFGMERMPCGQFAANAMFLAIGVLAYNLFKGFARGALDTPWRQRQVKTLRWRLYQIPGKVVRHAGQLSLKVCTQTRAWFSSIRERCAALALEAMP